MFVKEEENYITFNRINNREVEVIVNIPNRKKSIKAIVFPKKLIDKIKKIK